MISCREVAKLLTSDQLPAESFGRRLQVWLHLSMCRYCSLLMRQLSQMRSDVRAVRGALSTEKAGENLEARLLRKLGFKDE